MYSIHEDIHTLLLVTSNRSCCLDKQTEEQKWGGEERAVVTIQCINLRWWPPFYHCFLLVRFDNMIVRGLNVYSHHLVDIIVFLLKSCRP